MMRRKLALLFALVCILLSFAGCGKKCSNGCGESANSKCMAEMCDKCCDYFMGLNGCYASH